MTRALAVDFGTSNTVLAVWDEGAGDARVLDVPGYGAPQRWANEECSVIPSLVHYAPDATWIGEQVVAQGLYGAPGTFRWMKRYIANRSPMKRRAAGREIGALEAGRDFLRAVLVSATAEADLGDGQIALTVPVESFEHYEDWLVTVLESLGLRRFRLIDEASAAALGAGAHLQPDDVYAVFDFGAGTLDVSVVRVVCDDEGGAGRCRILGKAGADLGGSTLDGLLFAETLRVNGRADTDEDVRAVSSQLLVSCELAKERLSVELAAEVGVRLPDGTPLGMKITRARFEELLDSADVLARVLRTVDRAFANARESGYDRDAIKYVLLVGGSSQIPVVQQTLQRSFGRDRVLLTRPIGAVARGAAAMAAGRVVFDHIQHDYAVRWRDPVAGDYAYRVVVPRGTAYPTTGPLAKLTVKASHDGQEQLGLAICEMGGGQASSSAVELVFDPSGAARMLEVSADDRDRRDVFWMNESNPTFLGANPPARAREPRFHVEFGLDGNKRLLLDAFDLQTNRWVYKGHPVVRLD